MSTAPSTSGPTSNKTRTLTTNKLRPGERAPNMTVAFIITHLPMQLSSGGRIPDRPPAWDELQACHSVSTMRHQNGHAVEARQCTTEVYGLGDQMASRTAGTLEDRPSNCRR